MMAASLVLGIKRAQAKRMGLFPWSPSLQSAVEQVVLVQAEVVA
jgi:hypothetical protein